MIRSHPSPRVDLRVKTKCYHFHILPITPGHPFQACYPAEEYRTPNTGIPVWTEYAGYSAIDSRAEAHRERRRRSFVRDSCPSCINILRNLATATKIDSCTDHKLNSNIPSFTMADFSQYTGPSTDWIALEPTLPPMPELPILKLRALVNKEREDLAAHGMASIGM